MHKIVYFLKMHYFPQKMKKIYCFIIQRFQLFKDATQFHLQTHPVSTSRRKQKLTAQKKLGCPFKSAITQKVLKPQRCNWYHFNGN